MARPRVTTDAEKFNLARRTLTTTTPPCGVHAVGVIASAHLIGVSGTLVIAVVRRPILAVAVSAQTAFPVLHGGISKTFLLTDLYAALRSVALTTLKMAI